MKKIFLGTLLVVALIAVSYYNADRTENRTKQQYQAGYGKGASESAIEKTRADSLESAIRQARGEFEDSLKIIELAHSAVVDSLNERISAREKELSKQLEKQKLAARKNGTINKSKPPATKQGVSHAHILEFYRGRLKELPTDLSPYERSIALTDIRDQTTKKFSISSKDLQKIRDDNKLAE